MLYCYGVTNPAISYPFSFFLTLCRVSDQHRNVMCAYRDAVTINIRRHFGRYSVVKKGY